MEISRTYVYANDIENIRYWYMRYFAMRSSELLKDRAGTPFYCLGHGDADCSLIVCKLKEGRTEGMATIAFSVASSDGVDFLTELLRTDGNAVVAEPERDATGRYGSMVLDPEGNEVIITE